ncbi:MAG: tetratricopeptide repeat protein [Pseudomonadales bacterium]
MIQKFIKLACLPILFAGCTYTPLEPQRPSEQLPQQTSQTTIGGDQPAQNGDDQNTKPNTNERVAIATPSTVNTRQSSDRLRNERSATDDLRAQAQLASRTGDYDKAERLLNRALRIAPREPLSYYELAELKLKQHQPGSALQMARKGLSLQPVGRIAKKLRDTEQRARDSML